MICGAGAGPKNPGGKNDGMDGVAPPLPPVSPEVPARMPPIAPPTPGMKDAIGAATFASPLTAFLRLFPIFLRKPGLTPPAPLRATPPRGYAAKVRSHAHPPETPSFLGLARHITPAFRGGGPPPRADRTARAWKSKRRARRDPPRAHRSRRTCAPRQRTSARRCTGHRRQPLRR